MIADDQIKGLKLCHRVSNDSVRLAKSLHFNKFWHSGYQMKAYKMKNNNWIDILDICRYQISSYTN